MLVYQRVDHDQSLSSWKLPINIATALHHPSPAFVEAFTLYVGAIIAIDLIGHQDFTGASEDALEAQALFQGGVERG